MANIITPTEFAAFRQISKKIDTEKINESISLAQKSDLYNILGDFYFDVLANLTETTYEDLLDGSTFEYCDENFIHDGLKSLLADYTYARYVSMLNINLTPFGVGSKFTEDSNPIDRAGIRDLSKQAQIDAGIKFKTIKKYLLSQPTLFERYCSSQAVNTSFNSLKISKL